MSTGAIVTLGALAGLTIFLGLPVGRARHLSPAWRALLNALAIGILVFLLVDVLGAAAGHVEDAMVAAQHGSGSWASFTGYGVVGLGCLGIGLVGLSVYEEWTKRRARRFGPGASAVGELSASAARLRSPARHLAMLIAIGIGLHNFAEGLAIGQSAAAGETSLALLLVIGFGLHNATEGFGIVAPLAAEQVTPSWRFLLLLGLIGGGPTFVGTLIGQAWVSTLLATAFLALAGGSILYVVVQLIGVAGRLGRRDLLFLGIFGGLAVGFITDFVLTAAGA